MPAHAEDSGNHIVTLRMDAESWAKLDAWRKRFFPVERNVVPAHVSLFHALPGAHAGAWVEALRRSACSRRPFRIGFVQPKRVGGFVAVGVQSAELGELRAELASTLRGILGAQDSQPHRPHVTVVNKVPCEVAIARHAELVGEFLPWTGTALGLDVWLYAGGPWREFASFPFQGGPVDPAPADQSGPGSPNI